MIYINRFKIQLISLLFIQFVNAVRENAADVERPNYKLNVAALREGLLKKAIDEEHTSHQRQFHCMMRLDAEWINYDDNLNVTVLKLENNVDPACIRFHLPEDVNNKSLFKALKTSAKSMPQSLTGIDDIGSFDDRYAFIVEAVEVDSRAHFYGYIVNRNKTPVRLEQGILTECTKQQAINYWLSLYGGIQLIQFTLGQNPFQIQHFEQAYFDVTGQKFDAPKDRIFSNEYLAQLLKDCKEEERMFGDCSLPVLKIGMAAGWLALMDNARPEEKEFLDAYRILLEPYSVRSRANRLQRLERALEEIEAELA